jgi:Uncharacterised protein family UPF0547
VVDWGEWKPRVVTPSEAVGGRREARETTDAEADSKEVDVSPVGLGMALTGAVLLVLAVFLPYLDTGTFTKIKDNTLIQQGYGWWFVGVATGIAVTAYGAYRVKRKTWAVIVLGVIAIGFAIYFGTDKDRRTLVSANRNTDNLSLNEALKTLSQEEVADPAIAVYVAGVGGLLAVAGGWHIRRSRPLALKPAGDAIAAPSGPTQTCPDCAETVLAAARVCKHCGYRFDAQPDA